jgi:hypothetical protein
LILIMPRFLNFIVAAFLIGNVNVERDVSIMRCS